MADAERMINRSPDRAREDRWCPICRYEAEELHECHPGIWVAQCTNCGRVSITEEVMHVLGEELELRRKVQWINRNYLQGDDSRTWCTSSGPQAKDRWIRLDEIDTYPVPAENDG
jgi:hypothetical protein